MTPQQKDIRRIHRLAAGYNLIPSLLWTAVFLIPVTVFCVTKVPLRWNLIFLGVSLVTVFFPNSFFDRIQLSKRSLFYKRAGVKYIGLVTQNGRLINNLVKKKYPSFRTVKPSGSSLKRQLHKTYFFEKFHFSLFVFFTVLAIYAGIHHHAYWLLVLVVSNLFYNVYPNLLQQYMRVRLRAAVSGSKPR